MNPRHVMILAALSVTWTASGCGGTPSGGGDPDGALFDAAPADAAPTDAQVADAAPPDANTTDAWVSDAAPVDAAPTDARVADAAPPDANVSDAWVSDAAPADGGLPDAGGGDLTLSLGTIQMWANCMPLVPPDPWHLTVDVTYDNSAGATAATAVVTTVKVVFSGGSNPALDMTVTPTVVGPVAAGASATVTHTKTASSPDIPNDCGLCGGQATLEVRVDIGGTEVVLTSSPFTPLCAY